MMSVFGDGRQDAALHAGHGAYKGVSLGVL